MSLLPIKSNDKGWLNLIYDFTHLFFPDNCLGCSSVLVKGEEILCTQCLMELPKTEYTDNEENPVLKKFLGRIPIKHAWAFMKFRKAGIVQHLLHQLKYNNKPEVGLRLGKLFGKVIHNHGWGAEFDIIIPMPLHHSRERRRGYNQSAKFAEGLTASLDIPSFNNVIIRSKKTTTQTRKNKTERWENVEDAFSVIRAEVIQNKRILLVDDIITTGASIEACASQLLKHGCAELSVACLAEAQ